jgi:hypothetical protein
LDNNNYQPYVLFGLGLHLDDIPPFASFINSPRAIDFHSRCRSPTTKSNFTLPIHLWMSKTLPLYAILKFQFKLQPSLLIKNTNQYFFPCQAGLDTKVGYITLATVHLFRGFLINQHLHHQQQLTWPIL